MKHVLFALVVAACTSDPASAHAPNCAPPAGGRGCEREVAVELTARSSEQR